MFFFVTTECKRVQHRILRRGEGISFLIRLSVWRRTDLSIRIDFFLYYKSIGVRFLFCSFIFSLWWCSSGHTHSKLDNDNNRSYVMGCAWSASIKRFFFLLFFFFPVDRPFNIFPMSTESSRNNTHRKCHLICLIARALCGVVWGRLADWMTWHACRPCCVRNHPLTRRVHDTCICQLYIHIVQCL